jgi:UDP-N-acetylglucosamine--N-acetylmuramyl-(pentapeptide) pyrophosphoryl-undecaprenol N-acetylglucosamine transferase
LKARGHDVYFAGSLAVAEDKIKSHGFIVHVIPSQGLVNRSPLGIIRFILVMSKALVRATILILKTRPQKVVGFGGYGSFPVILAAKMIGVPSMIHEQNVVPGKANALMAKMTKKIAISFKSSSAHFPPEKVVWTGCPCYHKQTSKPHAEIIKDLQLDPAKKIIVLLGGSQGSQKLNEVFFEFMNTYADQLNLQGIHMTGKKDYPLYADKYTKTNMPVKVYEFIHNIDEVYQAADLVIARSGASTVTELGLLGVPAILVPYPFAEDHQKYNAEVLASCGAAELLEQKNLTVDSLKKALENILLKAYSRTTLIEKTKDLFSPRAAENLAGAIENF